MSNPGAGSWRASIQMRRRSNGLQGWRTAEGNVFTEMGTAQEVKELLNEKFQQKGSLQLFLFQAGQTAHRWLDKR